MSSLVDRFHQKYGRLPTEKDPDYLEMLRMSKYRIYDLPPVAPAKCANCGSTKVDGRKYVDFDLQIDWYGVVYLCTLCLHDIAANAGLYKELSNQIKEMSDQSLAVHELWLQGEDLKHRMTDFIKEVKEYFDNVGHYAVPDDVIPDSSSSVGTNQESAESAISAVKQESSRAKSGTTKSTPGARSQKLPSLAELLESGTSLE